MSLHHGAVSWQVDKALCAESGCGHKRRMKASPCITTPDVQRLGPLPSFGGLGIFKNKEVPNKIIKLVAYVKYLTKEGINPPNNANSCLCNH